MKIKIHQERSFADAMVVEKPNSDLYYINDFLNWDEIAKDLKYIQTDYDIVSLLKALLIQTWYNLSDDRLADALHRDLVFMDFCGFSISGNKPDKATICRFRNKLNKENIWEEFLDGLNECLEEAGLDMRGGGYVSSDATLVPSARRPKKKLSTKMNEDGVHEANGVEYSDDKDASWVKKGKKLVYGYNSYMSTNSEGLVLSVDVTSANESEMKCFADKALPKNVPKGTRVLYDKGADSHANRELLKSRGLRDGIMRKKPKGKQMPYWEKQRNKAISKRRYVVERVFGTIKRVYGFHRARYLGIQKVRGEAYLKACAYNLRRAVNLYKSNLELNYI